MHKIKRPTPTNTQMMSRQIRHDEDFRACSSSAGSGMAYPQRFSFRVRSLFSGVGRRSHVLGITPQMSCRRRNASNASLAVPLTETQGMAAVSSIWLVKRHGCLSGLEPNRQSGPLSKAIRLSFRRSTAPSTACVPIEQSTRTPTGKAARLA